MSAEKERLVLMNRAEHAPRLRDDITGATPNGTVLTYDSDTQKWYAAAGGGGGGGAPTDAQYLVLAVDGALTHERVLTAGAGITITDGGAGSTLTVAAGVPTQVHTTSGPTDLTIGNWEDGQVLQRSGSTAIGVFLQAMFVTTPVLDVAHNIMGSFLVNAGTLVVI